MCRVCRTGTVSSAPPSSPSVLSATLDAVLREDFEERAGIIEFEAVLPRAHAECLALIDVLKRHPEVLTGSSPVIVTVLQIELDGETQWLLTTDLDFARRHLSDIGAIEIAVLDLAEVTRSEAGHR